MKLTSKFLYCNNCGDRIGRVNIKHLGTNIIFVEIQCKECEDKEQ